MVLKQMPDVLCPWCTRQGGLEISNTLLARPVGSYSIAGAQLKFSAVEVPKLSCKLCEQEITGHWDGPNHAVFPDPHS